MFKVYLSTFLFLLGSISLLNAQARDLSKWIDVIWDDWVTEHQPREMTYSLRGVDRPNRYAAWNESGNKVCDFRYKYDYTADKNKITAGDSMFYDENQMLTMRLNYQGADNAWGMKIIGDHSYEYKNGLLVSETKKSINYASLNWKKTYSYNNDGLRTEEKMFKEGKNPVKTTAWTYDENGLLILEKIVDNSFGGESITTTEHNYNANGTESRRVMTSKFETNEYEFKYSGDRLVQIQHFTTPDGGDEYLEEIADLEYDEKGRLIHFRVVDPEDDNKFYDVKLSYEGDQNIPSGMLTQFPTSNRIFTEDMIFEYKF